MQINVFLKRQAMRLGSPKSRQRLPESESESEAEAESESESPGWKVLLRDLHKRRKPNINIGRESIKMKLLFSKINEDNANSLYATK